MLKEKEKELFEVSYIIREKYVNILLVIFYGILLMSNDDITHVI